MKMTDVLSVLHGKMLKTVEKEKKCRVSLLVLSEWEAHGKNIWVFCSYAVFSSIIMYNFLKKWNQKLVWNTWNKVSVFQINHRKVIESLIRKD